MVAGNDWATSHHLSNSRTEEMNNFCFDLEFINFLLHCTLNRMPLLWSGLRREACGNIVFLKGDIFGFFYVQYSTLLHLPPLRLHCVGECLDPTQDSCNYGIGCQTLLPLGYISSTVGYISSTLGYISSNINGTCFWSGLRRRGSREYTEILDMAWSGLRRPRSQEC